MIVVMLLNTTEKELRANAPLCLNLSTTAKKLIGGPFEDMFQECKFFWNKENVPEQVAWANKFKVLKLYELLKYDKGIQFKTDEGSIQQKHKKQQNKKNTDRESPFGFVRLTVLSDFIKPSGIKKDLDLAMNKAYYNE